MEWYNVLWARFSFFFLSSCSLSTRVFFFFFFNVCNPLLRCCWPWNATKSCQCFFWFSGRQQSKHKHSIINKREWLTGQARRISPQHAFKVASYLIERVQLSIIPKHLIVSLLICDHHLWPKVLTQGSVQKESPQPTLLFFLCSFCDFQKGSWGEGLRVGNFFIWDTWHIS